MPAPSRSLKRGLALLLGLLLSLASSFTTTFLPVARARSLSSGAPLPAASASVAIPPETLGVSSAKGSAGSGPITRLDQSARAAYAAGNGAVAASLWRQATEAARNGGDTLLQARLLSNLALAQLLQGQPEEAQRSLAAGFALLDAPARPHDSLHQRTRAQLLHARARLEFERGQLLPALTTWRQVAPLFQQLGASEAELASLINQAEALHSLGNLSDARTLLESLLQRPELSSLPRLKATALASLAIILQRQGNVVDAEDLAPRLLRLATAPEGDLRASQQANLALARIWSNTDPSKDFHAKAEQALKQAAATPGIGSLQARATRLAVLIGNPEFISTADQLWPKLLEEVNQLPGNAAALDLRLNLASSLLILRERKDDYKIVHVPSEDQLRQLLQRSQADADHLGNKLASSMATGELGALALSTGHLKEAETFSQQALRQSMAHKMPELSTRWLWQLGRIFKKQNNRTAALGAYQQAIKELENLRFDLASSWPADPSSYNKSLAPISREFIDLLTDPSATTEDEDLERARLVMENLQVAELNDFFRQNCIESISIARSNERNVAIVYPMLLSNRLEVIVRLPGEKGNHRHHSTDPKILERSRILNTVDNLLDQLKRQPSPSEPATKSQSEDFLQLQAQQLHEWILAPFEKELQERKINQLVFMPDANLRNLPMGVLFNGENKSYISTSYSIALATGNQFTPSTRRPGSQPRVLGAGVSTKIDKVDGLPEGIIDFSPLTFVDGELNGLRNRTGANVLLNDAFTQQALKKALESGDYSVVHLATHGQFSSNPNSTFLISGTGEPGKGERINVNQLANFLRLSQRRTGNSLDLLILSACESANGDDNANLGLAAVAARSGASSTIASLWLVDDEATAKLMDAFYRNWLGGKSDGQLISKAQALSLAQAELREDPKTRHPYYWAAFTLLGDWR
jgi:CHAT domain-containing protein